MRRPARITCERLALPRVPSRKRSLPHTRHALRRNVTIYDNAVTGHRESVLVYFDELDPSVPRVERAPQELDVEQVPYSTEAAYAVFLDDYFAWQDRVPHPYKPRLVEPRDVNLLWLDAGSHNSAALATAAGSLQAGAVPFVRVSLHTTVTHGVSPVASHGVGWSVEGESGGVTGGADPATAPAPSLPRKVDCDNAELARTMARGGYRPWIDGTFITARRFAAVMSASRSFVNCSVRVSEAAAPVSVATDAWFIRDEAVADFTASWNTVVLSSKGGGGGGGAATAE